IPGAGQPRPSHRLLAAGDAGHRGRRRPARLRVDAPAQRRGPRCGLHGAHRPDRHDLHPLPGRPQSLPGRMDRAGAIAGRHPRPVRNRAGARPRAVALTCHMSYIELTDGTADRYLLDAPGLSLLVFYSRTCATCRVAREQLPALDLPVDRLCWVDAGANGGLVARYEVFHLPSPFLVRDGGYYGPVRASLAGWALPQQLRPALARHPPALPRS